MPTTDDATPPELRTIVVTPVGGDWRERALEAEEENRAIHAELAALRRRRWTKAATRRWFDAGRADARERDGKRHRGHDVKVPMTIIAKLEAEGVHKGKRLAAEAASRAGADVRSAYRALDRWRKFKAAGLVFLVELDEQARLVIVIDETKSPPLTR